MTCLFFENTDYGNSLIDEPLFSNLYENDANEFGFPKEEDRRCFSDNVIFNNYSYYNIEDKTDVTNRKLNHIFPSKDLPKKEIEPPFYSLDTIGKMIIKNEDHNRSNELINKIIKDNRILEEEEYMNSTKKITIDNSFFPSNNFFIQENFIDLEYEEMKQRDNYLKIKRGRKSERNDGEEHDRYYADNIIKKIKAKIFDYCLKFLNKIIYKNDDEGIQLLKHDYKYIDQLNRKKNLDLFEMTLMDLFSLEVSGKYKSKSKDYNEKMIKEIIQQRFEIEDYDTILFLFKISLNDYIDLFTYKKDIYTLANEYNAVNVNYAKIQENFVGANHLLSEISKKNDAKYYTLFLLYTFNFQRWFYIKKGRNRKKKEFN